MELKRVLTLPAVTFIAVGFTIGGGVFVFTGIVHEITGPALPLAYALAAVPVFVSMLPLAMLGAALPTAGASYVYPSRMVSPGLAFVGVWVYALASFFGQIPLWALGCARYAQAYFPQIPPVWFALGLVTVLYAVNLCGVKLAALVQAVLVVTLVAALAAYAVAGAPSVRAEHFAPLLEKGAGNLLLGCDWFPQPKFMDPGRCRGRGRGFDCTAACLLGCRCGAKWNAAEWVEEAAGLGARVVTGARVHRVRTEGRSVAGVEGRVAGRRFTAAADTVVLCAGGIGSPRILQASGLSAAGVGMTMDTTTMVYGFTGAPGTGREPPMTWSWENPADGYMLSTLTDPWLLYPTAAVRRGFAPLLRWRRWDRMLGVMIKLKDEISGGIYPGGTIRKPLTARDRERLAAAYEVCRRTLVAAGAEHASIFMRPLIGTHPSGTVRIGELVDTDLATEIDGLYVCDASVFPEALDRPTVLTILGLGRRLARHLLSLPKGGAR